MKKIYKVFLAALMVLSMAALSFQEVNATDYDGFSVYAFTASDTVHAIPDNSDILKWTVYIDGILAIDHGTWIGGYELYRGPVSFSIYDPIVDESISLYVSTAVYPDTIENNVQKSFVIIVADDPDSFNAWGYTASATTHTIPDDIDLSNTIISVGGLVIYENGIELFPYDDEIDDWPVLTGDSLLIFQIYNWPSEDFINIVKSTDPDNGSQIVNFLGSIVIIEAAAADPYPEAADFYQTKVINSDNELFIENQQLIFGFWDNPLFENRIYVVTHILDLYRGSGQFNIINEDFITAAEYSPIPTIESTEFTVSQSATIELYSNDSSDLADFYSHIKLVDIDGDSTFSYPINTNLITVRFDAHFSITDGLVTAEYTDVYINNVAVMESAYQDIAVYLEGVPADAEPVLSGTLTTASNVDNPVTEAQIRANIEAWDDVDGDITADIVLVADGYTANNDTLGSYEIEYSVTDSSSNTSYLTVTVVVVDITDPVITGGTPSYTVGYASTLDLAALLASLSATDNYDSSLTVELYEDNYTANKDVPGEYVNIYSAEDASGNIGFLNKTINVVDDVVPLLDGPMQYTRSIHETLSVSTIVSGFTAYDGIDGDITASIVADYSDYPGNNAQIGSYVIYLSVMDAAGNEAQTGVTIYVVDNLPPVWYVKDTTILIDQSEQLTLQQILDIMILTGWIPVEYLENYTILSNQYTGNENIIGDYVIELEYDYSNEYGSTSGTYSILMSVINMLELETQYTVTFFSDGGTYVTPQLVVEYGSINEPADPTRDGYTFEGWYQDSGLTNKWNFLTGSVTDDMTLYASWTADAVEETPETIGSWIDANPVLAILAILAIITIVAVLFKKN
jgi:uncharacterized repeat protein (TIGR02543 family)